MSIFDDLAAGLLAGPRERVEDMGDFWAHAAPRYPLLAVGSAADTATVLSAPRRSGIERGTKILDASRWPMTEAELARPYLAWLFAQQARRGCRRVPWRRPSLAMLDWPHALWFRGGVVSGDLAYVDGRATYWQLYAPAALDMVYRPDVPSLGVGRVRFLEAGRLLRLRSARNTLIGICRSRRMTVRRWGGRCAACRADRDQPACAGCPGDEDMFPLNPFLAPDLWGYLCDTLHAVALEAVHLHDACYVHTDGWVVPAHRAAGLVDWLKSEWLIDARIKYSGPGRVWGCGQYEIGQHRSRAVHPHDVGPTNNLRSEHLTPHLVAALKRWRRWLTDP